MLIFDAGQSTTTEEHHQALQRVHHFITVTKNRYIDSVIVKGHSSKEGNTEQNNLLSQQRSLNTKLLIQSIDSTLLVKNYYFGSSVPNSEYKEKHKGEYDRRAEVVFYYRNR